MTDVQLSALAGFVLSLFFSYTPGLKDKFDGLDTVTKRLVVAASLLVVALLAFGAACGGVAADFGLAVTCDKPGVIALFVNFVAALAANQATFVITKINKPTVEEVVKEN